MQYKQPMLLLMTCLSTTCAESEPAVICSKDKSCDRCPENSSCKDICFDEAGNAVDNTSLGENDTGICQVEFEDEECSKDSACDQKNCTGNELCEYLCYNEIGLTVDHASLGDVETGTCIATFSQFLRTTPPVKCIVKTNLRRFAIR